MMPSPAPRDSYNTSPSTLAGTNATQPPAGEDGARPGQGAGPMGGEDDGLKAVVQQVRTMQSTLMDLAKQYPSASASLRKCAQDLRAALRDIIANPGAPEPTAPAIGG